MSEQNDQPISSCKIIFRHDIKEKQYKISRKAPLPPKFRAVSNTVAMFEGDDLNSRHVRYSNVENSKIHHKLCIKHNRQECLESTVNNLINKEKQYIIKLRFLLHKLEVVSTSVCNKLSLMKDILDMHKKMVLQHMIQISNATDVPNLFLKCGGRFQLYVQFAEVKNDFSYLVMDVCESIIDHFKARLLEYNFTLSEIKNINIRNLEVRNCCDEAEDAVKGLYQKIVVATRCELINE